MKAQTTQVLHALREHGSLSTREAMQLDPPVYRLAARIAEIREAYGPDAVLTDSESHGSGTHGRYRLRPGVWGRVEQMSLIEEVA